MSVFAPDAAFGNWPGRIVSGRRAKRARQRRVIARHADADLCASRSASVDGNRRRDLQLQSLAPASITGSIEAFAPGTLLLSANMSSSLSPS